MSDLRPFSEQIEERAENTAARGKSAPNPFETIPLVIAEQGRIKGFERLRDVLLKNWTQLAGVITPYNIIKLALETDRHALFAEVAAAKGRSDDDPKWKEFREYLQRGELPKGETDGKEGNGVEAGEARSEVRRNRKSDSRPRRSRKEGDVQHEALRDVRAVGSGREERHENQ